MLIREANLPQGAIKRPLLFKAIHKGSDIYDVSVLDFYTCRRNIIDQYTIPGCKCSSPKIDELKACSAWPQLAAKSGYAEPLLSTLTPYS